MEETPTKSTSSVRSPITTPLTQPPSTYNQHAFATPAFLRPTAMPIESPQSPSLPWKRIPGKIKGLSALINDYRANQQQTLEEVDHKAWEDEDELQITQESDSPGVAGRKPWVKTGAKRTTRRVISINPQNPGLIFSATRPTTRSSSK
jgi:DNA replication and checkpoint protein